MKEFKGKGLFLDRSDINTDEIIPAKYLTEIEKAAMKPHLLEDLKLDGFHPKTDIKDRAVIVTQDNFGCGSSREHAPWALEVNGINVVIAPSFARIFRQNMFNCGLLAIELSKDRINTIFKEFGKSNVQITVDIETSVIMVQSKNQTKKIEFQISEFDRALIKTGGWVEYADKYY
ncbi:3-isopropylmalate dehydratase small subunit [Desulfobacula sp.]|uniref:3-isopropylmalate dehydratase small subunit n=1 Tax=Desulfobacula sp. TaxID=2593537 RepID=UPI0025BE1909|nr:3-isopropylmalate dehydratase small subunit [Desulfobacula sp.]MBC2703649.1 3-isopropylmalate dehydratase small subunit [Desulfobacula sp.]